MGTITENTTWVYKLADLEIWYSLLNATYALKAQHLIEI